ncbi:hypothetical protein [Nocardioides convexus]|uniref:hypothetical protein n=1 Tax=Nocardioides convexus TaxID=2712224 RepID=UPI00241826CC|nr:hypothetical protein [Nocardioides convexus]
MRALLSGGEWTVGTRIPPEPQARRLARRQPQHGAGGGQGARPRRRPGGTTR